MKKLSIISAFLLSGFISQQEGRSQQVYTASMEVSAYIIHSATATAPSDFVVSLSDSSSYQIETALQAFTVLHSSYNPVTTRFSNLFLTNEKGSTIAWYEFSSSGNILASASKDYIDTASGLSGHYKGISVFVVEYQ